MKTLHKDSYEAPMAEVLVVKMENNLLVGSIGVTSTRDGDGNYGEAIPYDWN